MLQIADLVYPLFEPLAVYTAAVGALLVLGDGQNRAVATSAHFSLAPLSPYYLVLLQVLRRGVLIICVNRVVVGGLLWGLYDLI